MQSAFDAKPLCAALQEMEEAALSIQDNISRCKHDKKQTLEGIVDTEKQVRRCGRCCGSADCQQQDLPPLHGLYKLSAPGTLLPWQIDKLWVQLM